MYCGICGAKNEPGATFCGACGAPLNAAKAEGASAVYGEPVTGGAAAAVQDGGRHKKIGIAATAVVAVVAVLGIFALFGGRRDEMETAEQLFDAVMEADTDALMELIPPKVVDFVVEEAGYTEKEYARQLENSLTGELSLVADALEFLGDSVEISYEAVDAEEESLDELSYLQERYEEEFDMEIDNAKSVEVELRIEGFGQSETQTVWIPVIQMGSDWYLNVA